MNDVGVAVRREDVCRANREIDAAGLVELSFGNVSGADRETGVMWIKSSGIPCGQLRVDDVVAVSLSTGEIVHGTLRPSSDTPAHITL
jgi:L-ribulose-5-phosphate 4-epimerase